MICTSCNEPILPGEERADIVEAAGIRARADADWFERNTHEPGDVHEHGNALAVLICDPAIRLFLEENDPKALEQAREALGLPPLVEEEATC